MKWIIAATIIIACVCDKARDVYKNHADWRRRYPRLMIIPKAIYMKFQDRWHVVKQIGFLGALGLLDFLIWWEYGDWVLALAMVPVAYVVWQFVIQNPEHWEE